MGNIVVTAYVKICKENNILLCVFSDKLEVDLEIAKHCVKERIMFSNGISYPCLIDSRGILSVTREAREYLAKEGAEYVKAGALLIDSALTRMLGNIFLTVNKPEVPTKLFTSESEAIEWLQQYI